MKDSKIEWCDHTFNPWIGCTKVSPGCLNCYAERDFDLRKHVTKWGPGQPRHRTSAENWKQPLRWEQEAGRRGVLADALGEPVPRPRVFCASLADWLDAEVPVEWLADLLDLFGRCRNLDILALTKRPGHWRRRVEAAYKAGHYGIGTAGHDLMQSWLDGEPPANVWVGTTVENQDCADRRIPELLKIPARVRFLSCEPLLGPVHLRRAAKGVAHIEGNVMLDGIHWVICGGESGPNARPMLVEWADDLRRQCAAAGVAFFMKQLGAYVGTTNANAHDWPEHVAFEEVPGTPQIAGARVRLSDKIGRDIEEFPSELQIRQFPLEFKRVYP